MPPDSGEVMYVKQSLSTCLQRLARTTNTDYRSVIAPGSVQGEGTLPPFRRALKQYLLSKSTKRSKSKTPAFLNDLQRPGCTKTKEDVQKAMRDLDKASSDRTSTRAVRMTLGPVIRVLDDYSGIINTLGMSSTGLNGLRMGAHQE